MSLTAKEVLIQARARIDTPDKWCQGKFWDGNRCCMIGAIHSVGQTLGIAGTPAAIAFNTLRQFTCGDTAKFNDTHTHAEVLEVFDKAIAACDVPMKDLHP